MKEEELAIEQLSEEILKELDVNTNEGIEAITELDQCELNLRNVKYEENELEKAPRGKSAMQIFKIESKSTKLPAHERTRRRKIALKRILAQTGHSTILTDPVAKEHAKMVIPYMVEPYFNSIERTKRVITDCVTRLVNALIPYPLKAVRTQYGTRPFVSHPGFAWECSPEYNSHKYWVVPNSIYYFPQFSEMRILRENYPPERLLVVDKAIDRLLNAQINIRKRQTQIAIKLGYVMNYEDLINFNIDCALYIFQTMGLNITEDDLGVN